MLMPRMTTRRWMVVVAVVGLLCLLEHRRREFAALAAYHKSKKLYFVTVNLPRDVRQHTNRVSQWHVAMARKYQHAARFPWLPVEPDPPEPE